MLCLSDIWAMAATNYSQSLSEDDRPQTLAAKLSRAISILTVVCPCDRSCWAIGHWRLSTVISALLRKYPDSTWTHSHLLVHAYWDMLIVAAKWVQTLSCFSSPPPTVHSSDMFYEHPNRENISCMIHLVEVRKLAWQLSPKHSRINLFLFSFYCDHYGLFPSSEIRLISQAKHCRLGFRSLRGKDYWWTKPTTLLAAD